MFQTTNQMGFRKKMVIHDLDDLGISQIDVLDLQILGQNLHCLVNVPHWSIVTEVGWYPCILVIKDKRHMFVKV